ncbi:hypothetical protein [Pseudoalteromonas sp. MSK9-3]|uniref:hypothetical protein n=1 Tax=Pseudoalteromonas sp. MSK9-3 TaxID=1897633 RepID=UPI001603E900|nr:hypothetical protein [Pseudoalteromonas sp. MSK9-3]
MKLKAKKDTKMELKAKKIKNLSTTRHEIEKQTHLIAGGNTDTVTTNLAVGAG